MQKLAYWSSLVLIFTIPWENAVTIGGTSTLTRVIGLVAAGLWLLSVLVNGRLRKPHPFLVTAAIFILWNLASFFWTVEFSGTRQRLTTYAQLLILAYLIWDLYTTRKSLNASLQAYILGGYVTISSSITNFMRGQVIDPEALGRYAGGDMNANDLALILALGLPLAWHLGTKSGKGLLANILKIINLCYIPASLIAILLTASRTAIIVVIPAILYLIFTIQKLNLFYRLAFIVAILGTLIVLNGMVPQSTIERLATISSSIAGGDLGGRMRLWRESLELFLKHPIIGVGAGGLESGAVLGAVAHNTFISILAETGIVGFLFYIISLAIIFYETIRMPKEYASLWLCVLAVWFIGVLTLSWEFRKPTWLFLSWVIISARVYQQEEDHDQGVNDRAG